MPNALAVRPSLIAHARTAQDRRQHPESSFLDLLTGTAGRRHFPLRYVGKDRMLNRAWLKRGLG